MSPLRTFNVVPSLPDELLPLKEMAYNLWFAWNYGAIELFRRMDSRLWDACNHNPVAMLGRMDQRRLEKLAEDTSFLSQMKKVYGDFKRYLEEAAPYEFGLDSPLSHTIAYFSMEYGIHESIPNYSGGLGVLSGDHLKSASDLNIPLVGVGLLYQEGYFRQYLNVDGWQQELYPQNDFHNMPLSLVRDENGEPVFVEIELPGRVVRAHVWRIQVGRIPLYALDTNLRANSEEDRQLTYRLYGGDIEHRIKQEILLGIGGVRMLRKLGLEPAVFHMNEGHSAFSNLERIRLMMREHGCSYEAAREAVIVSSVFTTHTPVPAGNDRFDPALVLHYLGDFAREFGISEEEFLALGRENPSDSAESFCMTVLAIKLSARVNGVSKLHAETARKMWKNVWRDLPVVDIPIIGITNGIHTASFISNEFATLYDRYLGPGWREEPDSSKAWEGIEEIPDSELWGTHERRRERLVAFARRKLKEQMRNKGASREDIARAGEVLNPDILTICFARRFATYKRGTLLLRDPERLVALLTDPKRPIQIIYAGKAHPHDNQGKAIIQEIFHFIEKYNVRHRMVFLEDYDMNVARYMLQGADIWLNNPRRPLEASGTSGMKAAANGGLNVSVLDGWWVEGYQLDNGWTIGNGEEYEDEELQDEIESRALYNLLEKEIVPLFYDRGLDGIPRGWVQRMRSSLKSICPVFNTHRMLEDYINEFYHPAMLNWEAVSAEGFKGAKELARWQEKVYARWYDIRVLDVQTSSTRDIPVGAELEVKTVVDLAGLQPSDVEVDLYHGPLSPDGDFLSRTIEPMEAAGTEGGGAYLYKGRIRCMQTGRHGFRLRIVPSHPLLAHPHTMNLVLWA